MAAPTDRSKLKVCQYGVSCYRKNPIHFGEFSHPHLDQIFDNGLDPDTNDYVIPDELSEEIIRLQLKLLEKIFPKNTETVNKTATAAEVEATVTMPTEQPKATWNRAQGNRLGARFENSCTDGPSTSKPSVHTKRDSPSTSASAASSSSPSFSAATSQDSSTLAKKQKMTRNIKDYIPVVMERGRMAAKLKRAAPYNMFLTAVTDSKRTHNEQLTVTLQEILDESLGKIESTVQINFMVEIGWLLGHYYFAGIMGKPLLVLYGDDTDELRTISELQPSVVAIKVTMNTPFSTAHTKMMLLCYTDGSMRVVISTANLYEDDWHNRTQGIWISPRLPALPEDADTEAGESRTCFRQDLLLYLTEYKLSHLQPYITRIRKTDFSDINVFLIASVPGGHHETLRGFRWGHPRLGSLLQKHGPAIEDKVPVVCQSSSMGSLGVNIENWIQSDLVNSMRKDSREPENCRNPTSVRQIPLFKMIYPSFGNVMNSLNGLMGGGCLPYGRKTNDKQPWLVPHLHQWIASGRHRTQAMPHIKCYTRYNVQEKCVYWFCLTSANLSKAAWGSFNKRTNISQTLRISNYEAGVLFLPKFVTGEETFPLGDIRNDIPPFPLPYDVPLTPYGPDDKPFLMDYLQQAL